MSFEFPKNLWKTIECMESVTCVFMVKEGLFVSHNDGGLLN